METLKVRKLSNWAGRAVEEFGSNLTARQLYFITIIALEEGQLATIDLAERTRIDKSTIARNMKTLVTDGWVEYQYVGATARSRRLFLTQAGKDALASITA